MTEIRNRSVILDDTVHIPDLLDLWDRDGRKDVISVLWASPPHLTALFLNVGLGLKRLDRTDVNVVTNLLMDKFVAWRDGETA